MIFSVGDHIQQIISGEKTQTRRKSGWYEVGRTYAIQPGRAKPGIPDGRILITKKMPEYTHYGINGADAMAEGLYEPGQFEQLYSQLNPGWKVRWAYTFRFVPTEEDQQVTSEFHFEGAKYAAVINGNTITINDISAFIEDWKNFKEKAKRYDMVKEYIIVEMDTIPPTFLGKPETLNDLLNYKTKLESVKKWHKAQVGRQVDPTDIKELGEILEAEA